MLAIFRDKKRIYLIAAAAVTIVVVITAVILLQKSNRTPLKEGQSIAVTVMADSFENLCGYQFQLNYVKDELEYEGTVTSKIDDIQTIFSKPMDGYELVGATMVGESDGVSGKNKAMCEIIFTAKKEIVLDELDITISDVNIVQSDMNYLEDIQGWSLNTIAGS